MSGPKGRQGTHHQTFRKNWLTNDCGWVRRLERTISFNTELCVACNIGSMFSMLNLQLSFIFLHFLDPMLRTYTLIVGFTS